MATGPKGGLYQNAQSVSYLALTLDVCNEMRILDIAKNEEPLN